MDRARRGERRGFARRVRLGVGADPTASGATRVAGSRNFKLKYAPNYPEIAICHVWPGRLTSEAELTAAGVVAPAERRDSTSAKQSRQLTRRRWPSYKRCAADAPLNHGGTAPDISRAGFTFSLIATRRGWDLGEATAPTADQPDAAPPSPWHRRLAPP